MINVNKIAVIMSLYKNDRLFFLKKAIDSIINQTYSDFDLYIQFDGPINIKCKEYLESLGDNRIFIYERDKNKGLAVSLNELLNILLPKNYEYIARMDADDISVLDRFEKQILFLEANKKVDSLGSWAIEINEDGDEYFRKAMPQSHEDCKKLFQLRDCYVHPSVMFRRTYFEKAGVYPEDTYFGEDTMMWAKGFAADCVFANIPEYLINFRLDNNFFERRRGWKHAKSIFTLRRKVNGMLGFGFKANVYAYMYALAKLMPTSLLNMIYKIVR